MFIFSSVLFGLMSAACLYFHLRSNHYLGEALRILDAYNELVDHCVTEDSLTVEKDGVEYKFKKVKK